MLCRAGFLRTEGSGVFNMPAGATGVSMAVRDSAVFAGGTSTPGSGNLRIYGSFVQRGVGSSFQAGPGHNTWLAGAKPTVTFATPGITSTDSRFGQLWVARAVRGIPKRCANLEDPTRAATSHQYVQQRCRLPAYSGLHGFSRQIPLH